MDVMRIANERAASGQEVFHLEAGQPGTPAPIGVLRRAEQALNQDVIGYTDSFGMMSLRRRIARHYKDEYGARCDPARVAITTGSSGAFHLAFLAAFEAGDRVAMGVPCYPAYRNMLSALGVELVLVETTAESRFQPTVAHLEALDQPIDGLIVASPSNPTGTMVTAAEMVALSEYCQANGIRLISDEIYHGITYESPATSAIGLNDGVIVVNSFSKFYSMTGWRIGWAVVPEDLARSFECLAQNFFISPPTLSQIAAEAAFDCRAELQGHVGAYGRNRSVILETLRSVGIERIAPADGAFYAYADLGHLTDDTPSLCRRLLEETGVAIAPGLDFDPAHGKRFIRISFAGPETEIREAAPRLAGWLDRFQK